MFDSKLNLFLKIEFFVIIYLIRIVHGDMKLVIRIKHIDKTSSNLQKSPPPSNGIYMWSYCEHCREVKKIFEYLFFFKLNFLVISKTFNVTSYMVIIIYKIS
jgi:hypothetical protein